MSPISNKLFDALSWAKKPEKAGVPSEQAEAQVEMLSEIIENNACTKQDLAEVKKDLIIEMKKMKGNINTQIAKWVLGVSAIQATILVTLIRTMH